MNKKIFIFIIAVFLILSVSNNKLNAQEFDIRNEKWNGKTSYEISGSNLMGEWKSLLEFPLNTNFISLSYLHNLNNKKINELAINYKTNLQNYSGKFKDSDWVYGNEEKSIYSETKSKLKANIVDINFINLEKELHKNIYYNLKSGYSHKNFNFVAGDGYQISYLTDPPTKFEIEGDAIEYDVNYMLPNVSLSVFNKNNNKFAYSLGGKYIPKFGVRDHDYHILRDKHSYIKASGDGYSIITDISYKIKKDLHILFGYNYTNLKAKGVQSQEFENGVIYKGIDAKIKYEKKSFNLGLSYRY